ncbi:hypothetical protein JB92DRAFT_1315833 [Gautieria morchelliformis]|nr:hypothetical protein JB92DRAFT_1315833 [Gautieria morchelliformis]
MKRKVKEIELDNDRLHLKCLKARKNIQRLRLERAILYERLSTMSVAESNVSPVVSSHLPTGDPYPSPDRGQGQEPYQQFIPSPDVQARSHPDQSHVGPEVGHLAQSQYSRPPVHGVVPPHKPYDDNAPPMGYQQAAGIPTFGASQPVAKPRQRGLKLDIPGEIAQAPQPNAPHEVRNGGSRTFPFVHEYSSAQEQGETVFALQEYPSEIRFHQYEASPERRPANRNKRDIDRDTEKGTKHKRRLPQEIEKDQRRHPRSRSRSPTEHPSLHETYAYPIQNSFTSSDRGPQASLDQAGERTWHLNAVKRNPTVHDVLSQLESKAFGTRDGGATYTRHEYQAEEQRETARENVWQSPSEMKRKHAYSQVNREDRYARENDELQDRNGAQRGMPRGVVGTGDDVYSLPRVRDGEIMD